MRTLRLVVSAASPDDPVAAAGMSMLEAVVPVLHSKERILRLYAGNGTETAAAIGAVMKAENPDIVVALADYREPLHQVSQWLGRRYGREIALLWFGKRMSSDMCSELDSCDRTDGAVWTSKSTSWRDMRFICSYQTRAGNAMNDDASMSQTDLSPHKLEQVLQTEGVRFLSVNIEFTPHLLLPDSKDDRADITGCTGTLDEIMNAVSMMSHNRSVAGICVQQAMTTALTSAYKAFAASVMFAGHTWRSLEASAPADIPNEIWTADDRARVTEGWLARGLSLESLDREVLRIDPSLANGQFAQSILSGLGIADEHFRGALAEADAETLLLDCPQALSLLRRARSIRTRRPTSNYVRSEEIHDRILLPQLQRSARDREFLLYTPQERSEIVYRFLFEGSMHRELDKLVLGLDPSVSRGWQSMGVLHHLGLKKEYRGIFSGFTIEEAIQTINHQQNAPDFTDIVKILRMFAENNNLE